MKKQKGKNIFLKVLVYLGMLVMLCIFVAPIVGLVYTVREMEHHRRVYQNPLAVSAAVVDHDSYDDDGDTDYHSYISYTVDGVFYDSLQYESVDTQRELTPIGTQVTVQVSPEDPSKQLEDLKFAGRVFFFILPVTAFLLSTIWGIMLDRRKSKGVPRMSDHETIKKDAKLSVYGNMLLPALLMLAVGFSLAAWRYKPILWKGTGYLAAGCAILWLWCLAVTVRRIGIINRGEYELRRDVLIGKYTVSDSENGDTCYLRYQSLDRTWETTASQKRYDQAREGDVVLAVFIPKKKKPVVHYDLKEEGESVKNA